MVEKPADLYRRDSLLDQDEELNTAVQKYKL